MEMLGGAEASAVFSPGIPRYQHGGVGVTSSTFCPCGHRTSLDFIPAPHHRRTGIGLDLMVLSLIRGFVVFVVRLVLHLTGRQR